MLGRVIYNTAGYFIFIPEECEFCQLDSAGNHQYGCPYHPDYIDNFIPNGYDHDGNPIQYGYH